MYITTISMSLRIIACLYILFSCVSIIFEDIKVLWRIYHKSEPAIKSKGFPTIFSGIILFASVNIVDIDNFESIPLTIIILLLASLQLYIVRYNKKLS